MEKAQKNKKKEEKEKNQKDNKSLGQFIMGEKLGEGMFGKVRIGTHILTGEKVAIKLLEKMRILEQADKVRVEREIRILKQMKHSNIIQLYSVIQTSTTIYLVMEYSPGRELFDYIVSKKRLSETEACEFFQQIVAGVDYMHRNRICHRDLKPENMLLDSNRIIKIIDFGLSNNYGKNELLATACGSPCYAAPEMIAGNKYQGIKIDTWSVGIILYAMVCGYLPFEDSNNDALYKKILDAKFAVPSFVSDGCKDMIKKILTVDPNKRFTIQQIREHPWFGVHSPPYMAEGLLINAIVIPVDEEIVTAMVDMDFTKEEVRCSVLSNKHNHITTAYYLMVKSKLKKEQSSISDLVSIKYLDYIHDKKNLLTNFENDINVVVENLASSKGKFIDPERKEKKKKKKLEENEEEKKDDNIEENLNQEQAEQNEKVEKREEENSYREMTNSDLNKEKERENELKEKEKEKEFKEETKNEKLDSLIKIDSAKLNKNEKKAIVSFNDKEKEKEKKLPIKGKESSKVVQDLSKSTKSSTKSTAKVVKKESFSNSNNQEMQEKNKNDEYKSDDYIEKEATKPNIAPLPQPASNPVGGGFSFGFKNKFGSNSNQVQAVPSNPINPILGGITGFSSKTSQEKDKAGQGQVRGAVSGIGGGVITQPSTGSNPIFGFGMAFNKKKENESTTTSNTSNTNKPVEINKINNTTAPSQTMNPVLGFGSKFGAIGGVGTTGGGFSAIKKEVMAKQAQSNNNSNLNEEINEKPKPQEKVKQKEKEIIKEKEKPKETKNSRNIHNKNLSATTSVNNNNKLKELGVKTEENLIKKNNFNSTASKIYSPTIKNKKPVKKMNYNKTFTTPISPKNEILPKTEQDKIQILKDRIYSMKKQL